MSKAIESLIECPFYIKEGDRFIRCEGHIDGTQTVQRFASNAAKENYEVTVCGCFGGRNCIHYRNVYALYDSGVRV